MIGFKGRGILQLYKLCSMLLLLPDCTALSYCLLAVGLLLLLLHSLRLLHLC